MTAGLHPKPPTIRRERRRQTGVALLACKRASISRPAAINVKSLKRHLIFEGPTDANAYASLVCTYARWPLLASCGKYLRCISCRTWLCRCPEAGHQQQIVCSLTPCRFATTAIGSRSPRRRIATTCSSVNFDLRMLPSDSEGSLSTNRMARKPWVRSRYSEAFKKSSSSPNAGSAGSKVSSRRRSTPHTNRVSAIA